MDLRGIVQLSSALLSLSLTILFAGGDAGVVKPDDRSEHPVRRLHCPLGLPLLSPIHSRIVRRATNTQLVSPGTFFSHYVVVKGMCSQAIVRPTNYTSVCQFTHNSHCSAVPETIA